MASVDPRPARPFRPTDSPWFWALAFSAMAVVALAAIAPKFDRRQGRLESRFAGREELAAERARRAAGLPATDLAEEAREPETSPPRIVPLWPLACAAGAVAVGAAAMLAREARAARVSR
jgi:hypothetical protein